MKTVVILGDGMADYKIKALNNKSILDVANKPYMDMVAKRGEIGLSRTVPPSMKPGSDNANLSVMGYNALECYTGRSPLEAVSIGVHLDEDDITFRCNLITVSNDEVFEEKTLLDYSADEITTEEARELINALKPYIDDNNSTLYAGISYRHCLKIKGFKGEVDMTPPHNIPDQKIKDYLPKGANAEGFLQMYKKSYEILSKHPVNLDRIKRGLRPANCCWLWGMGTKPALQNYKEKYNVDGAVISAVDLIKGIGMLAGMEVIEVEGATGNVNTNFDGKAKAAIDAFKRGKEYVYVHMEAPDEAGHRGELENKIKAVELIDQKVLKPVWEYLESTGEDYNILVMPDHPTPVEIRTHVSDPVPFALYRSYDNKNMGKTYTEDNAKEGIFFDNGFELCAYMLNNK